MVFTFWTVVPTIMDIVSGLLQEDARQETIKQVIKEQYLNTSIHFTLWHNRYCFANLFGKNFLISKRPLQENF